MSEIKLIIEDKYVRAFLELLKTLNYVAVREVSAPGLQPSNNPSLKEPAVNDLLSSDDPIRKAVRPLRKGVRAEDLIAEQGYQGTDWKRLEQLAVNMDIQEPVEDLLAQLTT